MGKYSREVLSRKGIEELRLIARQLRNDQNITSVSSSELQRFDKNSLAEFVMRYADLKDPDVQTEAIPVPESATEAPESAEAIPELTGDFDESEARRTAETEEAAIAERAKAVQEALEEKAESKPEPVATDDEQAKIEAIKKIVGGGIDPGEVEKIVEEKVKEAMKDKVKITEIELPDGSTEDLGHVHPVFKKTLKYLQCKMPVYLVGPAGSGKSTLGSQLAKALELDFFPMSVGAQTTKSDLFGYMDANGNYVSTIMRKAFQYGGLFLMDEIDAGSANVTVMVNAAFERNTSQVSFPDGVITKHENFRIIAAANTHAMGNDRVYVGRNPLDGATLDRFTEVQMNYDENFEFSISSNKEWTKKVQAYRKAASDLKEKIVISPRASIDGGVLLSAGMKEKDVEQDRIWKGIPKDTVRKIKNAAKVGA